MLTPWQIRRAQRESPQDADNEDNVYMIEGCLTCSSHAIPVSAGASRKLGLRFAPAITRTRPVCSHAARFAAIAALVVRDKS